MTLHPYAALLGMKVYIWHLAGIEPLILEANLKGDPLYPFLVKYDTELNSTTESFTVDGVLNILSPYPCVSTTPYDPITGEGKMTPFAADELLKKLSEPQIGDLCVFSDNEIITTLQRTYIDILAIIRITNGQYPYQTKSKNTFRYCRKFSDFDSTTGLLKTHTHE